MARLFFLAILFVSIATHLQAGVLTNGVLTVSLRSNGAIDNAIFSEVNFFKPGTGMDVSNFGLQSGFDTTTFLTNRTNGSTELTLTETGYDYEGNHFWSSGHGLEFLRSYSLVAGLNALRVTTTVTNIGATDLSVALFDTFDPDQAYAFPADPNSLVPKSAPFQTYNDVISVAGGLAGQASINTSGKRLTVLVGSLDSRAVVASGGPLQIGSGKDLNKFLDSPFDANGTLYDKGTHIGLRQLLGVDQSTTFTYIMAFGETPDEAQRAFTLASVPEPASVAVFGAIGICALFFRRRPKRACL